MSERNIKLQKIRKNLQQMPELKKKTQLLEQKYRQKSLFQNEQNTVSEKQNSSREDSSSTLSNSCQFSENYNILGKIDEGCNSVVYKCQYKQTGKIYAVKKLTIEEEHILNLKKDFITLKQLNHPSICRYKALYIKKEQNAAYIVMEYIPHHSLSKLKLENQNQLRSIVIEILEALSYLHSKNVCHRDIKPQNIIYDQQSRKVKIIDFGVSKRTFQRGQRRDMLTIIGTHHYLAPEVYLGGGYNQSIDLWALGITVYQLVTGHTPFESQYHSDLIASIIKGDVDFSGTKWSKYSSELRSFVDRLLNKADKRMNICQAKSHLWLANCHKINKRVSGTIAMNQTFHRQQRQNAKNAKSKEEGNQKSSAHLFKIIQNLDTNIFELEQSDDEEDVVIPKMNIKSSTSD